MKLLRRLLGDRPPPASGEAQLDLDQVEEIERRREVEALRAEQARMDDFRQQQLRYARYAWRPPREGGNRRADDEEAGTRGDE